MTQQTPSTRRDPRFDLPSGAGYVEFQIADPGVVDYRADLMEVSVAGLTFELDAGPRLDTGTLLKGAIVHIGDCEVEGELSVKHTHTPRPSRLEVGCLFYPSSQLGEERWSAAVAGVQAAKGVRHAP